MGLIALAAVACLWTRIRVLAVLVPLLRDAGLALLMAVAWLSPLELGINAHSFLLLCPGTLIVAGLLYGVSHVFNFFLACELGQSSCRTGAR